MFVEENDIWEKSGKTNGSAQTRKAAANDEKRDLHKISALLRKNGNKIQENWKCIWNCRVAFISKAHIPLKGALN